ncbi:histone protein [Streptomyces sp. NPDC014724]|uniref:histone protein n=1 Tax=unclassified Streptomyces TaxID=2593676 RepID=UPI0036F92F7B
MTEGNRLLLAVALVGGYVLGRTKKGRLALTVASYVAGRQFGLEPRQLVNQGVRKLGEIPQVTELGDQLRGEVMAAGREAMAATADRRLAALADSLRERTLQLESGREKAEGEEEEEPEEEYEEEPEEEYEQEEPEEEHKERPRSRASRTAAERKTRSRASEKSTSARTASQGESVTDNAREQEPTKKHARAKKSATEKTAAKKPPAKKAAPRKKAPSAAKKSAKKTSPHTENLR